MEAFTEPILQRILVGNAGAKYRSQWHAQIFIQHITPTEVFLKGFELLRDEAGKRPKLTSEIVHAIRRELVKLGIEKATWIRIDASGQQREVMTFRPDVKGRRDEGTEARSSGPRTQDSGHALPTTQAKGDAAQYATEGDCELA